MSASAPGPPDPTPIHSRAMDNLHYIRRTMEAASSFTAVPGLGTLTMGLTALPASLLAARQGSEGRWLLVWILEAAVAAAIGVVAMARKAARAGIAFRSGPARRFLLAFSLPVLVAVLLTAVFYHNGLAPRLPGLWLLLYGTAVLTGGLFSIRPVQAMGTVFLAAGALALALPAAAGNLLMALGFGGVHIAFGLLIARNYGG